MSREALVLLVCCCDFRDGAERLIPSKSLRNAVIRAFPGLLCILRMCAPRRAAAVVRPRGREKSADRRRRILISRLLIIRASVPRRKSPFPAYFKGFPAVSPLIPPYPAFLKYPVSPHYLHLTDPAMQLHYVALFQTGWFLESMWTQVLILHFLRTRRIPFVQSRPSAPVMVTTLAGIVVFTGLTFTKGGGLFGLTRLPLWYFGFLLIVALAYMLLTTVIKTFYQKKHHQLI